VVVRGRAALGREWPFSARSLPFSPLFLAGITDHLQTRDAQVTGFRIRELLFPSSSGDVPVRIRGSKAATKLSEFFRDRDKLLRDNLSADDFEAKWRGVHIAGQEVFADAASIFLRADAGDLKVENLYASAGGAE
jgi:hypothetical protein